MNLRHEWKHRIAPGDLPILRARLGAVMKPDPNGSSYHVRSLYFDTPADTALREKLDGVNRREKFRIRCYNKDFSLIHLEKKSKCNGLGTKEKAKLTREQVRLLLAGEDGWMADSPEPLIRELYVKRKLQGLRPRTIVDYIREPYVFGPGNVRVTLDHHLRTGLTCTDFLDPDCVTIPAPDSTAVLEVKWDEFLPDVVRDLVQIPGRRTAAFSKYAACRMYD